MIFIRDFNIHSAQSAIFASAIIAAAAGGHGYTVSAAPVFFAPELPCGFHSGSRTLEAFDVQSLKDSVPG